MSSPSDESKSYFRILGALLVVLVLGAAVPATVLYFPRMQTSGDGGGFSWTNLNSVQVTNQAHINQIVGPATNQFAGGIAGQTPWLTNINANGFNVSNANVVNITNLSLRGAADFNGQTVNNAGTINGAVATTLVIASAPQNAITITGGVHTAGTAGTLKFKAGSATTGTGGALDISAGSASSATGSGGSATIAAGDGRTTGNGGNLTISAGNVNAQSGGTPGMLKLFAGFTDGGKQNLIQYGYYDGFGTFNTNWFAAPTMFWQTVWFCDTNGVRYSWFTNGISLMMSNSAASIGIRTNNTGTNALVVNGHAEIASLSVGGIPFSPNNGTNAVVQSLYSYPTTTVPTGLTWYLFFTLGNNLRIPFTTPIGSGTAGIQFAVPINGWNSTDANMLETHEVFITGAVTNTPITFGDSTQNWIWIGDNGTQWTPTNLAPNQLYVLKLRHRGGNTNILASWLTTTNSIADY